MGLAPFPLAKSFDLPSSIVARGWLELSELSGVTNLCNPHVR
jgi:hypothetical protein